VEGTTTLANVVYVVAGQRIETSGPTVFVIEAAADGHWSADVRSGELRIAEPGGGVSVVKARTRRRFGKDRPAVASAADLLAQARTRRGAGDIPGAIAAYEELILRYPNVAASRTAMVTLGQLRLDLGQAKKALRWFDRYVEGGGALAEDAQFGRIRALRALGRRADEREAIDAFLAKYPSGSYAAKLRGR
jgi:tetratricopeptide (TPR) repeat protein